MPSVSANCMATAVRDVLRSTEPTTRLTVPSPLTLAETLERAPQLPQKVGSHAAPAVGTLQRRLVVGMGSWRLPIVSR